MDIEGCEHAEILKFLVMPSSLLHSLHILLILDSRMHSEGFRLKSGCRGAAVFASFWVRNRALIDEILPSFLPAFLPSCLPSFLHSFIHSFLSFPFLSFHSISFIQCYRAMLGKSGVEKRWGKSGVEQCWRRAV